MPNPLSTIDPLAMVYACNPGTHRPLHERPELAVLAIEAIDSWTSVENVQLGTFVRLLGGHESLAANLFLSLGTQSSKSVAINAAAEHALSPEHRSLLVAILGITKTNQKSRDKLAHWSWGSSPHLPDALLLLDPRAMLTILVDPNFRDWVMVYVKSDFESIIRDNERLCRYYGRFRRVIDPHDTIRSTEEFDGLCAEPEIRERLDRQGAQGRSAQAKAP